MTIRSTPTTDLVGLFTTADAHAAGWTDDAIRYAVASGQWIRVRPGLYRSADEDHAIEPTSALPRRRLLREAVAATRGCDRAVLSHAAAAILDGLPVIGRGRACVSVATGTALRRLAGVHLHRAGIPDDQLSPWHGGRYIHGADRP